MKQNTFYSVFILFWILLGTYSANAGNHKKPRCTSFQETSRQKATTYVSHVREFSTVFPETNYAKQQKLLEALDLVDDWLQQQPETADLGSIIGSRYFPQSLINCVNDIVDDRHYPMLDLLQELMITEMRHTTELTLTQSMLIFSAINKLLIVFFAAILALNGYPDEYCTPIHSFFTAIFDAQTIKCPIPFSPKLARAHSV